MKPTDEKLKKGMSKMAVEGISKSLNNKIDIKYSGIPNVCFSLIDKDHVKDKEYSEQRKTRGFDDSETWSLTNTIASFIIPRLERYIELADENIIRSPVRIQKTNELLEALKLIDRDGGTYDWNEEEIDAVNLGMSHFGEIFTDLTW